MMSLQKIIVPANWNAEKDIEHFASQCGPTTSYMEALWKRLCYCHAYFVGVLDSTLLYFRDRDPSLVRVHLSCLNTHEKLEILVETASASLDVSMYRTRLIEDLEGSKFVENERGRIIREFRLAGENAWMYPVLEITKYMIEAASHLDDIMSNEADGFEEYRDSDDVPEEPDDQP